MIINDQISGMSPLDYSLHVQIVLVKIQLTDDVSIFFGAQLLSRLTST